MRRHLTEDNVEAPPSVPRRKALDREPASLTSVGSSTTGGLTSSTNTMENESSSSSVLSSNNSSGYAKHQMKTSPGAYASKSPVALKKIDKLAMADTCSVPSVRDLNDDPTSWNHSSEDNPSRITDSLRASSAEIAYQSKSGTSSSSDGGRLAEGTVGDGHLRSENEENESTVNSSGPGIASVMAAEVRQAETEDISAQVEDIENRLRQGLFNTPPEEVQEAEVVVNETLQNKKGRTFWILLVVLLVVVVGGSVGAVVGVMSGRNRPPTTPPDPTLPPINPFPSASPSVYVPPCTLCFDGSQPDLEAEVRRGVTCADLQAELTQLDDPEESSCLSGQATGWLSCSCPTLPRRPPESICSAICPADARPPAFDTQSCRDFETFVELAGVEEEDCAELLLKTPEECVCSKELDELRVMLRSISNEEDLLDTTTPQHKAMVWLANDDPAKLDIDATPLADIQVRYFAALLWYSLGGENWNNQYNFMSADGICDWKVGTNGLSCSELSDTLTTINIEQNNLLGTLPGLEMSSFRSLEVIQLANNDIRGSIPPTISNLASLRIFSIWNNLSFGGTLPSSLFGLRRLTRLWLDDSQFAGSLPSNIGEATSLTSLSIPHAGLTGTIPTSISLLTALVQCWLHSNSFTGSLPSIDSMPRLNRLLLNVNQFDGTIPDHYGQSPVMERMELGVNDLAGTIPDFSESLSLQDLGLEDNLLTGNVVRFFNTTPTGALKEITLHANRLTGTIPTSLGRFTNLDRLLWLQANPGLEGTLPTEVGLLTSMTGSINFSGIAMSGTMPTELGRLTLLQEFFVAQCRLSGKLPSELGEMTALFLLAVNGNELTGTIPSEIGNLQSLKEVSFANNLLNGQVPSILAELPNLELILLQTNQLTGTLDPFCDRGIETVRADCEAPAEIICECCECF